MSSYHPGTQLPAPSVEQVEHSSRLIEVIIQRIEAAGGVISFKEYMQLCLYQPGLGYYSAGSTKFGAAGDFVTAPEISALFGYTLANHARGLFEQGLQPNMLEFGAGSGRLCVDIITRLNELGVDWQSYQIVETSSDLQQRQRALIEQKLSPRDADRISWLSALPVGFNGLLLGNEVLDAMPVNVVLKKGDWLELGVGYADQQFVWQEFSRHSEAVLRMQRIDRDNALPNGYCSELNLNYEPWCNSLLESCNRAVLLLIDYGYERAQYYHAERVSGTLVCFYQHRVHSDPFIYPGLQDITAFVDFDALAEAAVMAGFSVSGMTTQAQFLMANGLLELMQRKPVDDLEQMALAQQVKTLTLPGEMGEKFKVIGMQKNLDLDLPGI